MSRKPGGRLPLLSARPAVTVATHKLGLLPISLLGEQRHDGCEQFASVIADPPIVAGSQIVARPQI